MWIDGVRVRVHAAALHAGDYFIMRGVPYLARFAAGWPKPKDYVPGFDLAGHVEAVGKNVTRFQPADEVFAMCGRACAEYACAAEGRFVLKPAGLTFEQAAAVPTSAFAALLGLRDAGKVQPGQKVLINGASGGVGTFAVQHVIDYTQQDFTRSGQSYDLILDNVANRSFSDCRRALTPRGTLIPNSAHAGMGYIATALVRSAFVRQQGRPFVSIPNNEDLVVLKELIDAGKVRPVIDGTYRLSETPETLGYVGEGHARGKVVITM